MDQKLAKVPAQQKTADNNKDSGGSKKIVEIVFFCNLCSYSTDKSANLNRHVKTMHETVKESIQCCGLKFSNKADFRDHNKLAHADGHKCEVCYRKFSRRALLRRHFSVHNGYREFKCPYAKCTYASSHKSNLTRHMRVHGCNNNIVVFKPRISEQQNQHQKLQILQSDHNQHKPQQQRQQPQLQINFQPDSTTKTSPIVPVPLKNVCSSHYHHNYDNHHSFYNEKQELHNHHYHPDSSYYNNSNNNDNATQSIKNISNASCSSEDESILCPIRSNPSDYSPEVVPRIKTSKISHSIDSILSRSDSIRESNNNNNNTESNANSTPENENKPLSTLLSEPDLDEVTSTTSPLISPNMKIDPDTQGEGRREITTTIIQDEKKWDSSSYVYPIHYKQEQQWNGDYESEGNKNLFDLSRSKISYWPPIHNGNINIYNDANNNASSYETITSSSSLSLSHSHNDKITTISPQQQPTFTAPRFSSTYTHLLAPTYDYASSLLPVASALTSPSLPVLSSSSSSTILPTPSESFYLNPIFHPLRTLNSDFKPANESTTNGQKSSEDLRILPPYHSPYAVPARSTSCYYNYPSTFQPKVLVSESSPSSSTSTPANLTLTSTQHKNNHNNSHQHQHNNQLSSPGLPSTDSSCSSCTLSFARVSNYQATEFVSY